jgi:hypothetical protein
VTRLRIVVPVDSFELLIGKPPSVQVVVVVQSKAL